MTMTMKFQNFLTCSVLQCKFLTFFFSGSHVEDIKLFVQIFFLFQIIMKVLKGNRNILIFFLIITTSTLAFAKVDQDVSCDVTSHYANGQTSYEIKCQQNSDLEQGRLIQCCAMSNELGLSYEWGSRCGVDTI